MAWPHVARAEHLLDGTIENPTPFYLEFFGGAVAPVGTSGEVLIGAPFSFSGGSWSGSVYHFDISTGSLVRIYENPTGQTDRFGWAISSVGSTVAVGAALADGGQTASGAVYGYDAATGALLYTLSGAETGDEFGTSVAPFGATLIVGAPWARVAGQLAGAVYLYDGGTGALLKNCPNPSPHEGDGFGFAVGSIGSTIIVGGPYVDAGQTDAGVVYLFDGSAPGSDCPLIGTLQKPPPVGQGDYFGIAVAGVAGGGILVGVPRGDPVVPGRGAAYLFDAATTAVLRIVSSPKPGTNPDSFGWAVAAVGANLLVGAPADHGGSPQSGAVYVFDGSSGALVEAIDDPRPAESHAFGFATSAVGTRVVAAAPQYAGAWPMQGAAYVFRLSCGNGVLETGEACDDGNLLDGDCCSSTCGLEPDGSTCSDTLPCTVGDGCAAGVCGMCAVGTPCAGPLGEGFVCQLASDTCVCGPPPSTTTTTSTIASTSTSTTTTSTTLPPNRRPTANAGTSRAVATGQLVQLDGTGSFDPDDDALMFTWELAARPAGSATLLVDATSPNPSFVPDVPGVYVVNLTVSDGIGLSDADRTFVSASVDGPGITVTITEPADSMALPVNEVTVRGTLQGANDTGVTVNGVAALVRDGTFVVDHVRLSVGANTIRAEASIVAGLAATHSVTVAGTDVPPTLTASVSPRHALTLRPVTLGYHLSSGQQVAGGNIDWGDDTEEPLVAFSESAIHVYETAGLRTIHIEAMDDDGVGHSAAVAVLVQDVAEVDQILKGLWLGMNGALSTGDKWDGLAFLTRAAGRKYEPVFDGLLPYMPQIIASYSPIRGVILGENFAEYAVTRVISGEIRIFLVAFVRDSDGVWRLDGM